MAILEEQFEILRSEYPTATLEKLASGAALVDIPNFPLPQGWSPQVVRLKFLAPVGYPLAKPDCFWVDPSTLRLSNGVVPKNTGSNPIPEVTGTYLWFSWHIGQWNPNRDNLITYIYVIKNRFKELQ